MATQPLLAHAAPDAVVAYRAGVAVRADRFLTEVLRLADALPPAAHVLNLCKDRYRFAVSFAACLVARRISLLPPSLTPHTIRQLGRSLPGLAAITDDDATDIDLPLLRYPPQPAASLAPWQCPQIEHDQVAACLFTSGSTGVPLPFRKTWGHLVASARDEARRLGLLDGRRYSIVGTVPSQHMFGFEATVLVPLQSGNALHAERPLHPAEIRALLAVAPPPRVLVSTPVHLRALLASAIDLPALDLVLSSTAPLSRDLACEVEARFATRLLEIYGSTETGQLALRRPAQTDVWRLCDGVTLTGGGGDGTVAQGAHIEQPTTLCDVIERIDAHRFLLHGRRTDVVNIAGKRSSIAHLNHHLLEVPGIIDGAFVLREDTAGPSGVTRLAAIAVAPGLAAADIMAQLRLRIDPVFLPRPLLLVEALPRNDSGKMPQEALRHLVTAAIARDVADWP